jgi:hypothetical protein
MQTGIEAHGGDLESALSAHAARMENDHAAPDLTGQCQICNLRKPDSTVTLVWAAIHHDARTLAGSLVGGLAAAAFGHGWTSYRKSVFTTFHGLCSTCYWKLWAARACAAVIEKVCFALLLLGALCAVFALVLGFVTLFSHPTKREILVLLILSLSGVVGIFAGLCGPKRVRRWGISEKLREIGKWPFALEKSERSRI